MLKSLMSKACFESDLNIFPVLPFPAFASFFLKFFYKHFVGKQLVLSILSCGCVGLVS